MKKVLFIVGPTATGKTDLGLRLASRFKGAIISADSVQVYKGLDIVSGKDLPGNLPSTIYHIPFKHKDLSLGFYEVRGVSVYLLDIVTPSYSFSVSDFVSVVLPTIDSISSENLLPIVVGGTGFYIKALLDGVDTLMVPPNEELRKFLGNKTVEDLAKLLVRSDSKKYKSMNESDRKNKRRIIRAIEIVEYQKINHIYSSSEAEKSKGNSSLRQLADRTIDKLEGYDILMIGLFVDRQVLKQRIDERVDKRIEQGAFLETESLFKNYKSLSSSVRNANGYKQLFEFLQGKISRDEAINKWKKAEYLNAKKQMTWFRKDKRIKWFDIQDRDFLSKITETVEKWLV